MPRARFRCGPRPAKPRARASRQVRRTLSGGVISGRERKNLEKYRAVHHVDEKDHAATLSELRWTEDEYERGFRTWTHRASTADRTRDLHSRSLACPLPPAPLN